MNMSNEEKEYLFEEWWKENYKTPFISHNETHAAIRKVWLSAVDFVEWYKDEKPSQVLTV